MVWEYLRCICLQIQKELNECNEWDKSNDNNNDSMKLREYISDDNFHKENNSETNNHTVSIAVQLYCNWWLMLGCLYDAWLKKEGLKFVYLHVPLIQILG